MTTPQRSTAGALRPWLLVIDGSVAPDGPEEGESSWSAVCILGLPVVLRLALTAQAAGAGAIVLTERASVGGVRALLVDDRLRVPVLDDEAARERRAGQLAICLPSNLVVHRSTLIRLQEQRAAGVIDFAGAAGPGSADWEPTRGAGGPFGFEPIAVASEASALTAERALLRSLRKPQDGWTSTYLNRPISLAITRRLVSTPLRPNQVSLGILAIGLTGALLASRGTYGTLLAGAALFQAQSVLDGCDGEMSRLTFRGSHLGEWLDTIGDDLTNYGFFGGAAWGLYTSTGRIAYLALGAVTVACGILGSGLEYRYLLHIGSGDLLKYPLGIGKAPGPTAANEPRSALARGLDAIAPAFKRDTFVLLTLVAALLGRLGPMMVVFAAGAAGVLFAVIKAELRMLRERPAEREQRG
jgi:phosphatidylglycerophosphate synthase